MSKNLGRIALFASVTLCVVSGVAHAAAVTYDFTGVVTSSSGFFSNALVGEQITGTYTFDLGAANPSQSSGAIGPPPSTFLASSYGGTRYSLPAPGSVFASTAVVGAIPEYSSFPPESYDYAAKSSVEASSSGYTASERVDYDQVFYASSGFAISTPDYYTAAGLPLSGLTGTPALSAAGYLDAADGSLTYQITSLQLQPVPLPAALLLLLSGLGGFGALVGRGYSR
jgi:hypothetical protein